jgi:hypothetical protein
MCKISFRFIIAIAVFGLGISSCHANQQQSLAGSAQSQEDTLSMGINTTASLESSERSLSDNFMCFNLNSVLVPSWQDTSFLQFVNQLNPSMLRIPGGEVANYWDWQRGGIIRDVSGLPEGLPNFLQGHGNYTASKLEDFQAGLKATDTTPLFVLNMLTSDLESQMEMLRTASKLGMTVKYIELGNEFYFGTQNYRQVFPNPQDYAQTTSQWITAIRQEFPDAEISVLGTVPNPEKEARRIQNWNRIMLKSALPKADAITLHYYRLSGLDNKDIPEQHQNYPFFTAEDVPIILGEPFKNWQDYQNEQNFQLIPEDTKIWITEYNINEPIGKRIKEGYEPRIMGSWAQGMSVMVMSLLFLEDQRVDIICKQLLFGNFRATAILQTESIPIAPNQTIATTPSLSNTGIGLRLLGNATEGMTTAQKIKFSNNPTLTGKEGFSYPALYGWMFGNGKERRAVMMNLSDQTINVDLSSVFSGSVNYEKISGDPRTLVTEPGVLKEETGSVSGQITLPGYAIVKLATE